MTCERCGTASVIWAHDATTDEHKWENDAGEATCCCLPEPVCVVCELQRIQDDGFLLLPPRAFGTRAVAFGRTLVQ